LNQDFFRSGGHIEQGRFTQCGPALFGYVSGVNLATPTGEHHDGTADEEQPAESSDAAHQLR